MNKHLKIFLAAVVLLAGLIFVCGLWPRRSAQIQGDHQPPATGISAMRSFLGNFFTGSTVTTPKTTVVPVSAPPTFNTGAGSLFHPITGTSSASPSKPVGGMEVTGQPATATITIDGNILTQEPNQIGVFPRLQIKPKGIVQVSLNYPMGSQGDVVAVQVEDGGHLNVNGQQTMSQVAGLDNQKNIKFEFQATEQLGIYRIAVRNGADVKVVSLWAEENVASGQ